MSLLLNDVVCHVRRQYYRVALWLGWIEVISQIVPTADYVQREPEIWKRRRARG